MHRRALGRRPTGDPVDGAAALGAGLVGADLAGARRLDVEPQLLLEGAGDGTPDRVVLPAGGLGDLLDRGALGALEHLDHQGLLGAGAGRGLLGRRRLWPALPASPWRPALGRRGRRWRPRAGAGSGASGSWHRPASASCAPGAPCGASVTGTGAVALVMQLDPEVGRAHAAVEQARSSGEDIVGGEAEPLGAAADRAQRLALVGRAARRVIERRQDGGELLLAEVVVLVMG